MNERYLFRGKRADDGTWICGDLISTRGKYYIHPNANSFEVNAYNLAKCAQMIEVAPETVGQCTGLKDKNGKWIFENDIVTMPAYRGGRTKSVVYFKNGKFAVDGSNYAFKDICPKNMEVIGNIYDNKELLEAER